jgi:outer membrane protein OmpA-like peptidoglycan-associated protein
MAEPTDDEASKNDGDGESRSGGVLGMSLRDLRERYGELLKLVHARKGTITLTAVLTFLLTVASHLPAMEKGTGGQASAATPEHASPVAPATGTVNVVVNIPGYRSPDSAIVVPIQVPQTPAALADQVPQPATTPVQTQHFAATQTRLQTGPAMRALYLSGHSEPGREARVTLKAAELRLKADAELDVEIVGSSDKSGEAGLNQDLGFSRACAAAKFLESQGIARDRISVRSIGSQFDGEDADNRNVTIVFWKPNSTEAGTLQEASR